VKRIKFRLPIGDVAPWLMIYWALLAPASVMSYTGIRGLYSTLVVMICALAFGARTQPHIRTSTLAFATCVVLLSLGNSAYWGDYRYVFYSLFLLCALVLAEVAGRAGIERFCTLATSLMIFLLIGAVISALLARLGLPPVFSITNPDGQDYYFFYTGFTNTYYDNVIRPSAIYDEPGAFSMYICFTAALRHLLQRERRTTWLILALGFITFSLAHLIYVICHFLAEQASWKRIIFFLGAMAIALFALITTILPGTDIMLLSRLALTEDTNFFSGDNRSGQLINAWVQIIDHPSSIFFGLDPTCMFSQAICQSKFGGLGENPLSPLVFGGLFSEMPYYVVVFFLLASPVFGRRYIALFGMGLLFMQRPYVMGFSYALVAVLLLEVSLRRPPAHLAKAPPIRTFPRNAVSAGH